MYSASLNGNIDGCDCKSSPKSGLVKRAYYLRSLKDKENCLLFDVGDILDVFPDKLLADQIFEVYKELGYTAIAVGDQDFSCGLDTILKYRKKYSLISNNLSTCPDPNKCVIFTIGPLFLKRNKLNIGVFSLFDPKVLKFASTDYVKKLKITAPEKIAKNVMELFHINNVDLSVLLFHGYYESALQLIEIIDGIDIIILGHEQKLISNDKIGNTIIVSPGEDGNRLGVLKLYKAGNGKYIIKNNFMLFEYNKDPDDSLVRERIDKYKDAMKIK